jgi:hypothetical protein
MKPSSALCAALIMLVGCAPAYADVSCIQRELQRLGFDPGPIDGSLGGKTLTAAKAYQVGAVYLPDLNGDNTYVWCKALMERLSGAPFEADQVALDGLSATSGATADSAMGTTPILGHTPEYQVPAWVNNPH